MPPRKSCAASADDGHGKRHKTEAEALAPLTIPEQDSTAVGEARLACYTVSTLLGSGSFASVRRAVLKETGVEYAMKDVSKSLAIPGAKKAVAIEIALLEAVGIHRHVVSLVDHFETKLASHIVLELANGGEVFERIANNGPFTEAAAATVVRQVAAALQHVHAHFVVHSDIKPENLLYVSEAADADVKLADFGLGAFCGGPSHPKTVSGERGSLSYIAPEEIRYAQFDHAVDLWALGVSLFVLLGGYLPFDPTQACDAKTVQDAILQGKPAYTRALGGYPDQWKSVSKEARKVIGRMLDLDPIRRISATQLLAEPWVVGAAPQETLPASDLALKRFNEARKVWRMAADAVGLIARAPHTTAAAYDCATCERDGSGGDARGGAASSSAASLSKLAAKSTAKLAAMSPGKPARELPDAARRELQAAFAAFDEDGSGEIELGELRHAMRSLGASEGDAEAMLQTLDVTGSGTVTFAEFAAATAPLYEASSTALRRAFDFFDRDGSGAIEKDELEVVLTRLGVASEGGRMHKDVLNRIFATADANHDGKVSFPEFIALFATEFVDSLSSADRTAMA